MRCPIATVVTCLTTLVQAQQASGTLDLDDASQLFQATAHLREGPQEKRPSDTFMKVLEDMKARWKQHQEEQMKQLEPWKLKELRKQKARHHGERPKPTATPKQRLTKVQLERDAYEEEAKVRWEKYGDPLRLTIVPLPEGTPIKMQYHMKTRWSVLLRALATKLNVTESGIELLAFRAKKWRPITLQSTPQWYDFVDDEVIRVSHPMLEARYKKVEAAEAKVELRRVEADQKHEQDQKRADAEFARKSIVDGHRYVIQAEQKRLHDIKKANMITLRFRIPHTEGEDVKLAVRKNNWLDGYMNLVTKRLGLEKERTRFLYGSKQAVLHPHDSVRTTGLKDNDVIMVHESKPIPPKE